MEALGVVANVIAVVDLSFKLGVLCGDYINKARNAKDDIQKLKAESVALSRNISQVKDLLDGENISQRRQLVASEKFRGDVKQCEQVLQKLLTKLDPKSNPSRLRVISESLKWPLTSKEVERTIIDLRGWRQSFASAMQVDHLHIALRVEDNLDFNGLPAAKGAAFDDYDNEPGPVCHPETRRNLLQQIIDWASDTDGKCVFWLRGLAGTGKSTISRTIARYFAEQEQLAASFFFDRTSNERNRADLFVTTVARQLIRRIPKLRDPIMKAVQKEPDIPGKSLQTQFDRLILRPLKELRFAGLLVPALVFVIDALDECYTENIQAPGQDRSRMLVKELTKLAIITDVRVRVFLTSRPEVPIRFGFREDVPEGLHQDVVLHEIPRSIIDHDIRVFIETQLEEMRKSYGILQDWPGESIVQHLVDTSTPLFIYAATICKFVNDPRRRFSPRKQLEKLLSQSHSAKRTRGIATTYQPILEQLLVDLDDFEQQELLDQFGCIVGSVVLLADPLSIPSLSRLLQADQDEVSHHLNNLQSVLSIPEDFDFNKPVRIFHLSFKEYVLDNMSGKNKFWVDEKPKHGQLLECCLRVMIQEPGKEFSLRNDICRLKDHAVLRKEVPTEIIGKYIPKHLEYACLYWVHHLAQTESPRQRESRIHDFLARHFVHWIEAMSWMGHYERAIADVLALKELFFPPDTGGSAAADFILDAQRFLAEYKGVIDIAPCQIYSSAILFSPENSVIKTTFLREVPQWVTRRPEVAQEWDSISRTFHRCEAPVEAMSYSQDGRKLAIATKSEVTIWLVAKETIVALRHNADADAEITKISFFPNGTLAIGMNSGLVLLWDFEQGRERVVDVSSSGVSHLSISTNGRMLCARNDGSVRLLSEELNIAYQWQTRAGGKTHDNRYISYSPDGSFVAFFEHETNDLRVYDAHSGQCLRQLQAPAKSSFGHLTISPENLLLVILSCDRDDPHTGAWIWDLNRTEDCGNIHLRQQSLYFEPTVSQNGVLAAFDAESRMVLWDLRGTPRFLCQPETAQDVCFSPDGKFMCAKDADLVRIIDIDLLTLNLATQQVPSCTSHAREFVIFCEAASSPDGSCFAMISSRGKLSVWDSRNLDGPVSAPSRFPPLIVETQLEQDYTDLALDWSKDGEILAIGFLNELAIYRLQGHPGSQSLSKIDGYSYSESDKEPVRASKWLAFSPCGSYICMVDGRAKTCHLWHLPSLTLQMSEAPEEYLDMSAVLGSFSPNKTHLALLNDEPKLRLINLACRATTWELKLERTVRPTGITHNSTGSLIAIGLVGKYNSQYGDVLLVNAESGSRLSTLPWPDSYVDFSQIAFTCYDQVITIPCQRFEERRNIKNPHTADGRETSDDLGPCHVFGTIQRCGRDETRWIMKRDRRMILLPRHCEDYIMATKYWSRHPHRFFGYDARRKVPFFIDIACDDCTAEDCTPTLATT